MNMTVMPELFEAGFTQTKELDRNSCPQIATGSNKKNEGDCGAFFYQDTKVRYRSCAVHVKNIFVTKFLIPSFETYFTLFVT